MHTMRRLLKAICGSAKCDKCGRKFYAGFYCDDNGFDTEHIRGTKGQRYCPECLIRRKPVVIHSRWLTILPFGIYIQMTAWLSRLLHTRLIKLHRWHGCRKCIQMYGKHRREIYQ
ncbi:hypothetical protein ACFL6S_32775 [Candidatus Poribacteria bacterium]